jgi:hypothetical protein
VNCSNLEALAFGFVNTFDDQPFQLQTAVGFTIKEDTISALKSLKNLHDLSFDYFDVDQVERQVDLFFSVAHSFPALRSLSLCKSSFVTKEHVERLFDNSTSKNLAVYLEVYKFENQVQQEFESKQFNVIYVSGLPSFKN